MSLLKLGLKRKEIEVEGQKLTIQQLSAEAHEAISAKKLEGSALAAALIVASAVKPDGSPEYSEADIPALRGLAVSVLYGVASAINALNAPKGDDEKN